MSNMNKNMVGLLTRGSIRKILTNAPDPYISPIVQILETTFSRNKPSSRPTYKIFVSDGECGMVFETDIIFSKLHSRGRLSAFTLIRIDKYNDEPGARGPDCPYYIEHLTVLLNGRNVTKILGAPSIPSELNDWLKVFTIKLEMDNRMQSKADKFNLNCLNPATKISKLTIGCLEKICSGEVVENPIVQILSLVKIMNAEENLTYYSLQLSDGKNCFNRVFTQSFHFNNLVEAGIITKFSIIRLDRYKLFEFNTKIRITNLTVMNKGTDVKTKIGKTNPIELFGIHDRLESAGKKVDTNILTFACLSDILREVPCDEPILQILKTNQIGTLVVSDGFYQLKTEVMDDDICELILKPQYHNAVVRVDEYEVSFVKETVLWYKPILHVKKVTLVHSSFDKIIGTPVLSDSSKSMSEEECPVFKDIKEEESEQPAIHVSVPQKPIFTKGFLNKSSVVEEKPIDVTVAEQCRRLTLRIESLTVTHEINNETINVLKGKMSETVDKNTLLKKRLGKFSKTMLKNSQQLLRENFEIIGVEKKPNENLKLIVNKVLNLISAHLNLENDIVSVSRCAKTGNILAKCRNTDVRELVIAAKRGKVLNAGQLQLNLMKGKICINEHLTPLNKVLLIKAKDLKNEKVFDYAWVKNGRVYVRSQNFNDNKCIHIYSKDQIRSYSCK